MASSDEFAAEEIERLQQLALTASAKSYSPYSRFQVGAVVLLASGEYISGCNVENASYRLTTCAEQNAIAAAVMQYGPQIRIKAIVVVNAAGILCPPCGACRQTIAEFAEANTLVTFTGLNGVPVHATIAELLPAAFELRLV